MVRFGTGVTVLCIVLATAVHSQTRRIAHRAHSGAKTDHYDGRDGNYGGGTSYIVQSPVVLALDTMKTSDGRDSVYYRWDTLHAVSDPRLNEAQRKPVRQLRQLGYICSPTTVH